MRAPPLAAEAGCAAFSPQTRAAAYNVKSPSHARFAASTKPANQTRKRFTTLTSPGACAKRWAKGIRARIADR